jgi:protein-disulfide isomerase
MSEENTNVPATEVAPTTEAKPEVKTEKKSSGITQKDLLIPGSIVIAGVIICVGLYFGLSGGKVAPAPTGQNAQGQQQADTTNKIAPVTEKDHYRGNLNAPVKIVEYSDFECPFCKQFHQTLETVFPKYDGKVVWVFRQFPLEQLHKKAPKVAMASECVAELGGNDAFWKFTDGYFEATLSNDRTDIETVIPKLVASVGVDKAKFNECYESGRHQGVIDAHIANAVETGGRGTPWTIIIAPNGKTFSVNGSQSAAVVQKTIDTALQAK